MYKYSQKITLQKLIIPLFLTIFIFTDVKIYMINPTQNSNNINFTSKIIFIPRKKMIRKASGLGVKKIKEMWHPNDIKNIQYKGGTDGIVYCLAGIAKTKNLSPSIYHLCPDDFYHVFKEMTITRLNLLKKYIKKTFNNSKTKVFLIGGVSKVREIEGTWSHDLLSEIKPLVKKADKNNFSIFFSQKNNGKTEYPKAAAGFIYNRLKDTIYVNVSVQKNYNNIIDLTTPQEIRDNFEFIKISPNDKIYVGKKHIPNKFWNKFEIESSTKKVINAD